MKTRVLFVEDEKELIENLPPVLEAEGFEITGTTDVAKAIELFANSDFDVVLTDIAMPPSADMDGRSVAYGRETGIEMIRRMRAVKPDVPVVALTVIRDPVIIKRMREAGIRVILNKPEELQEIVEALRKVAE